MGHAHPTLLQNLSATETNSSAALALGAGTAARLLAAKPNSNFGGVQIGAITYSFRTLPGSAEEVLKYCVDCGISAVELMSVTPETYAGAPAAPQRAGAARRIPRSGTAARS